MITHNDLSVLQLKAYDTAMSPKEKIIRIVGYAGTGKTTVLACVAKEYGHRCIVLAPTNKAVMVLKEKGIRAQTIHSFLYAPAEIEIHKVDKNKNVIYHKDAEGNDITNEHGEKVPLVESKEMQFILKANSEEAPKVALIDEASMVGENMFEDLCSIFETVILFGDGFQLPPINDKDILNISKPDIFLDEVHRVAWENPITRFNTEIRNGKEPNILSFMRECQNKEIGHCERRNTKLFAAIHNYNVQCICGTNRTRHELNERIREQKGYPPNTVVVGEQVICLENWRELIKSDDYGNEKKLVFYNGQILEIGEELSQTEDDFKAISTKVNGKIKFVMPFWNKGYFTLADRGADWYNEWNRRRAVGLKPIRGIKMDYSYAVTAHKAQGSEYDNVGVFDEREAFKNMGRKEKQRWYYTACTRAKKRLLIINNEKLA